MDSSVWPTILADDADFSMAVHVGATRGVVLAAALGEDSAASFERGCGVSVPLEQFIGCLVPRSSQPLTAYAQV